MWAAYIFLSFCVVLSNLETSTGNLFDIIAGSIGSLTGRQEEAPYDVIKTTSNYEHRRYRPRHWVCIGQGGYDSIDQANDAFTRLFSYLGRDNSEGVEMKMSTPAIIEYNVKSTTSRYAACFFIESKFQANPPEPLDAQLYIVKRPEIVIYTRKFGGLVTKENTWLDEAESLKRLLSADGVKVKEGEMYWSVFDPPFKFWNRRNEVWLPEA